MNKIHKFISNKIRLTIFTSFAKIGLKINLPLPFLLKYFRRETIIGQIRVLFKKKKFPIIEKTHKPLDIVFLAYLGAFQGNNTIQITLAKVLQERGHKVRFLLCDVELPLCETTGISNHHRRSQVCDEQMNHLKLFFKQTDFEIIWLTDLISKGEIDKLEGEINDSNKWVAYEEAILLRYFKVGVLEDENILTMELRNRAKHAALISELMGNKLADLKPDRVFFSHGTYTTRGPAKEVLNFRKIPIISISRGKMAESQKFNWKTSGDWWDIEQYWNESKETPLNSEEIDLIDNYLLSRRNHARDIVVYNFTPEENKKQTLEKLNIDETKEIFTLFTNVLWDAASAQREVAFMNPIDWTIQTINWFRDYPEKQLIVRIHPAESIIGTNQPMEQIILDKIGVLPDNVRLIKPTDSINSWSLLKVTDIGLVHTSTVGLELALEGIPCICVSKTHFRGRGFTIDINNKNEYFDILKNPKSFKFDTVKVKELSLKYSYILFMKYQFPMPFFNPESHISINSFKKTEWEPIVNHISIQRIIKSTEDMSEYILEDKDVFKLNNKI